MRDDPSNTTEEAVLACLNPPSIWQFYPCLDIAASVQTDVNARNTLWPERTYTPMLYTDYTAAERAYYLDQPLQEITEAQWTYQHEVLPPLQPHTEQGMYRFLCSEFMNGPYTSQYAAYQGRYYTRLVDATDPTTWITRAEIAACIEGV